MSFQSSLVVANEKTKNIVMANSDFLRRNKNQHSIKNSISKKMDSDIDVAISLDNRRLLERSGLEK